MIPFISFLQMEGARGTDGAARAAAWLGARSAAIPSRRRRNEGLDPGEGTMGEGGGSVGQRDEWGSSVCHGDV